MKLIFIYGAPAVGKLSVAQEVAELTGFKVFHNHLSIDAIEPVFDFGTKPFARLIELIRVETIARTVEGNGGEVCFVLLTCERAEVEKRVLEESRRKYRKVKELELLKEIFDKYDFSAPVPDRESLQIDNTHLSARAAAQKIIEHYGLI